MKFITTKDREGKEELFIFPRNIDHDAMAEVSGIRGFSRRSERALC